MAGASHQHPETTSRPSDALYRTLVERVPDIGIFMLDPEGRIVSWNVGASQITGFRHAEILGQQLSIFYASADRRIGKGAARLHQAAAQRRVEEQEWLRRKDGTQFWADLTISPLHDEAERLVGYAVILHDRTERRQAEERQRRLSAMMKATPDFVSFSDPGGQVLYINDAGRQMLGIGEEEEIAGLDLEDCHPEWATALILNDGIPTAIHQGAWRAESALLSRSGREIPVIQTLVVHKTPTGEIDFFSVIARDITEPKQTAAAQQLLLEASRSLSTFLEYEAVLKYLVHLAVPRIADWCTIVMLEEDEVVWVEGAHRDGAKDERLRATLGQRHPLDIHAPVGVHKALRTGEPEFVSEISEPWLRVAIREPERARVFHELGARSGIAVPFVARGRTLGAMVLILSESDRRYGAADLRFAEELASRAALAIDNASLYQGEREAVSIRDEVLSIVAHDLRNPLGTISMTAELLLDTTPPEDEEARGKFEIIERAAQGMNRLIQDLLDVARIEAGQRLAIEPKREEVAPLVAEACAMLRPHAEDKGLRLSCEVPEHLPAVRADRDRILQVFSNLIGNALNATEHGAITVQAEPAEGAVRFAVADTGTGISEEDLPHLFERFWQARKMRKGGAGLGLAITRGIVEAHGGRIWVESRVGEGTTFFFTLPVAEEARLAQAAD
jgi:PAS domain S-box-containing protein